MKITKQSRFQGCLLGLAVGDAVGTTVEFKTRGSFEPMTDMVGGGVFNLEPGQWTDDTSMALCMAVSLTQQKKFNADDIMRRFLKWNNKGYLSSNGRCFDIGGTVSRALRNYERTGEAYSGDSCARSAGNGGIMRLAPVLMFYHKDRDLALSCAMASSKTTHGALECSIAAKIFGAMILDALEGKDKAVILQKSNLAGLASPLIKKIASGAYLAKDESKIKGNGYVVNSLEAALWCFAKTDNFRDAILKAANLGDDADTTAAITGQIAGAFYGVEGIPIEWRQRVAMGEYIVQLSDRLLRYGERYV